MSYDSIATDEEINKTLTGLEERGFLAEVVESSDQAMSRIKELIPSGASVMNGSSTTLNEIGFVDYLKANNHGWNNLHEAVLAEKDADKQAVLRKQSVLSDYYLGSLHAITQKGEVVIASNSGSQLPHLVFTSPNIILIVGAQKITSDMDSAMKRLHDYVFPLEDKRMKDVGMGGSFISKVLILNKEQPFMGRKFHIIFVKEKLGF